MQPSYARHLHGSRPQIPVVVSDELGDGQLQHLRLVVTSLIKDIADGDPVLLGFRHA
jgi:hypothetical protein